MEERARQKRVRHSAASAPARSSRTLAVRVRSSASARRWRLELRGRVLGEGGATAASEPRCFAEAVRRAVVQLDARQFAPAEALVEWSGADAARGARDGFALSRALPALDARPYPAACHCDIFLDVAHCPPRFQASAPLRALLGLDVDSHVAYARALWRHADGHGLLADGVRLRESAELRTVLAFPAGAGAELPIDEAIAQLSKHLSPPPPLRIQHEIAHEGESERCYSVPIDFDDWQHDQTEPSAERHEDLSARVVGLGAQVGQLSQRRDRLLQFGNDPATAIEDYTMRALRASAGGGAADFDTRRSVYYEQPWVSEAAEHYLSDRRSASHWAAE